MKCDLRVSMEWSWGLIRELPRFKAYPIFPAPCYSLLTYFPSLHTPLARSLMCHLTRSLGDPCFWPQASHELAV